MTSWSSKSLAALAVVAATSSAARAEPPPPRPAVEEHKSMLAAEAVALAGVYVAIRLDDLDTPYGWIRSRVALGMLTAAPSFGHLYAGERRRALVGMGLRVAALGVAVVGAELDRRCDAGARPCDDDHTLQILGATGFLGLTVWQLIDAPFAARRANRRARARELTVAPLTSVRGAPVGLSIIGAF